MKETSKPTRFSRLLRVERETRGWSQARLAEELGTTPNTISSWERGIMIPSAYFRERLSTVFNKNAAEFGLLSEASEIDMQEPAVSNPIAVASPVPEPSRASWSNRQRLLDKVANFWIRGVLEPSFAASAPLTPRLKTLPDAVASPLADLASSGKKSTLLPADIPILQIYDEAVGELLILGEPGGGKTTLLLILLRDLIERARRDEQHPLPVVFNLASWSKQPGTLTDWLIDELQRIYQVPRQLSETWIQADQILPLLDGLDEVQNDVRVDCIDAINTYHQQHGLLPLVVCSRTGDYLEQQDRLALQAAIVLQPLVHADIEMYLTNIGLSEDFIAQLIQQDTVLQELMTTPLMLSILARAYHNTPSQPLQLTGSIEEQRQQALATYAQQTLTRNKKRLDYPPEQSAHWLGWIARQLLQQQQAEFSLEQLQADALPARPGVQRTWRLINGLLFGLIFGLVNAPLFLFATQGSTPFQQRILPYLGMGAISGALWGIGSVYFKSENRMKRKWQQSLLAILLFGSIYSLGMASPFGFVYGLLSGIITWLEPLRSVQEEIQPVEIVSWSWRTMRQHMAQRWRRILAWIGIGSASLGITFGLLQDWLAGLVIMVLLGLLIGLNAVIIGGLASGMSQAILPRQKRVRPNEGIWRSAHNALLVGLLGALVTECTFVIVFALVDWFIREVLFKITGPLKYIYADALTKEVLIILLLTGLLPAFSVGLAAAWNYGGAASLKHLLLRVFLQRCNCLPRRVPQFLDSATESLLLRKVGGSYLFLHRLLLEYFVSLKSGK